MRKFTALLGAVAMLSILPATPVLAQVFDPGTGDCEGRVPNAAGVLAGPIVFGTLHVRENSSWTTMTCHFDLDPSLAPAKATHARGFNCFIGSVATTDTRASASSGGRMVLTCRLKK